MNALEIATASPWCQRWNERAHSWRHTSEGGFDASLYEVAPLDESTARAYVETHHYSGSYPAARLRYGLHCGPWLVGVAVLSVPVRAEVLTGPFPELAPYTESLELGRLVLADSVPANAESWFLARAFDLAAADGLRGVVSFADPCPRRTAEGGLLFAGHVGTIYQASNARYTGRGRARLLTMLPDGTVLNDRSIAKVRGLERGHEYVEARLRDMGAPARQTSETPAEWLPGALEAIGAQRIRHGGNHRYCFTLGNRAERRRVSMPLPELSYPKSPDA